MLVYLAADQLQKQPVAAAETKTVLNEDPVAVVRAVPEEGETQHRADGGVIYPVQHMEAGGMIASPYANPMKTTDGSIKPTLVHDENVFQFRLGQNYKAQEMGGVGGMFQNMQQQFGQQMTQMQSSPLKVYSNYLNETYTSPQAAEMQAKVTEFVDLVDPRQKVRTLAPKKALGTENHPSKHKCL